MRGFFYAFISIIVTTLIIPVIILRGCSINVPIREIQEKPMIVESDLLIKVYNHKTSEIMELYLEEYVTNVVASEMPASFEIEALKAQAVAARTYAIWKIQSEIGKENPHHPGAALCTSHQHCQEWLSKQELRERHGRLWMYKYWPRVEEAVQTTRGIIMTYNMQLVEPLYHSTSGGRTENSEDVFVSAVPYLRSVSSPYEDRSPVLTDEKVFTIDDFINILRKNREGINITNRNIGRQISINGRSAGGSVAEIKIGNEVFNGREIRRIFGLRSADFTIDVTRGNILFKTRGYGHGVGMSQWGANGMAERGYTFEEILKHYYQGISLNRLRSLREWE